MISSEYGIILPFNLHIDLSVNGFHVWVMKALGFCSYSMNNEMLSKSDIFKNEPVSTMMLQFSSAEAIPIRQFMRLKLIIGFFSHVIISPPTLWTVLKFSSKPPAGIPPYGSQ